MVSNNETATSLFGDAQELNEFEKELLARLESYLPDWQGEGAVPSTIPCVTIMTFRVGC